MPKILRSRRSVRFRSYHIRQPIIIKSFFSLNFRSGPSKADTIQLLTVGLNYELLKQLYTVSHNYSTP